MIEFSKTLREAREAKGLSPSQLAEATHMSVATIDALENERFDTFAAPIYVRGFIKLYCKATGIDPQPLLAEYGEILNGNRDPAIRERVAAPAEPVAEPTAPEPPPRSDAAPVLDDTPSVPAEAPAAAEAIVPTEPTELTPVAAKPPVSEPSFALEGDALPSATRFNDEPAAEPATPLSRYAAPIRQSYDTGFIGSWWRLGVLAALALGFLALVAVGIRSLYRATTPAKADAGDKVELTPPKKTSESAPTPAPKAAPRAPAESRTPQKIPSLYID